MATLTLHDSVAMWAALEEMGVLNLCPNPEEQVARTGYLASCVTGRPKLIPLVDLSLLAAELGDYGHATKYATEARTFHPISWELYNLCMVEGLIAWNAARRNEAVECLDKSIRACQSDEYTLLSCGVRTPNLALVQRLAHDGEQVEVVRHLMQCKDVWQSLRPRIDKWISSIKMGETPDFPGSGVLKTVNFSSRLQLQWMRALSIEEEQASCTPKSLGEVIAGRERLRADYSRNMAASRKRKLEDL